MRWDRTEGGVAADPHFHLSAHFQGLDHPAGTGPKATVGQGGQTHAQFQTAVLWQAGNGILAMQIGGVTCYRNDHLGNVSGLPVRNMALGRKA